MTLTKHSSVLLPSGFRDLLPPEAQKEETATRAFMDLCASYGYERIRPPLAEFEDALFTEEAIAPLAKEQAFRFVDPVSQRMMAMRFDMTTQVARIAASRMKDAPRPLRLMYANDVLRAKSVQQRMDRQFRQLGCEIIGNEHEQADLEVAALSIQALSTMGLETITIDLSYTRLVYLILESYDIAGEDRAIWLDLLASKDLAALKARPETLGAALSNVIEVCGQPAQTIAALHALKLNEQALACVHTLEALAASLDDALTQLDLRDVVQITLDPFELSGFEYHTGVCFTLYSPHVGAELGRGGRYGIQGGQSACGFTVYMDVLLEILPQQGLDDQCIAVPASTGWADIKNLQAQGWIVLREVEGYETPARATHMLKSGEIIKL